MDFLTLLFILLIVAAVWMVKVYNNLQNYMQSIRQYLSNLQAALKKRIDLSNQIVDIASSYGDHEKLTHLTLSNNDGSKEQLMALGQAYPNLKANQTYQQLMAQLDDVEQLILDRRENYNQTVKTYNAYRNSFPPVLIASKLKFEQAPYFDMEDEDFQEKVKVFERDDAQALKEAISTSSKAVVSSATALKDKAVNTLDEASKALQENSGSDDNSNDKNV